MLQKNFKIFGVCLDFYVICWFFIVYTILFSLLSVTRHNHFQSQANDFSIYDQALWLYSRFNFAFSTINNIYDLGDRFRPLLIVVSPIYWFTSNERVLLLFQSVILSAPVFPVWLLARKILPRMFALLIPFLYVNFIGIQAAVVYDFHEMALLPLLLGFSFYFLERKNYKSFFAALILCLSVREHVGLLLWPIGAFIFLKTRNLKVAVTTSAISIIWSLGAISFVMPALGQNMYGSFSGENIGLGKSILEYISRPDRLVGTYFMPVEKTTTIFWSLFSFGMLPLFYLPLVFAIFFQFASRFLDLAHPIRWTIYYHYSVELAIFLSVSTIYMLQSILDKINFKYLKIVLFILLFSSSITHNIGLHAPLKNLAKTDFWMEKDWMNDTRRVLSLVPKDYPVAAQNNLLPHLSHREKVYLLPEVNAAQYVVFDLHPGQNSWNFYTLDLEKTSKQMYELVKNGEYVFHAVSGNAYVLKKHGV